ncbi:HEAT repeat domain-containing protein [Natronolimnobius baerhuensis]|uniref:Uncharacterized protein n=1 Tax=Natronolimnobius baerhuensis TaxID=253108 RepID=A0A202EB77_9EURY|nr:HEAT repeat domain-containing protein [Natronolimnobius baerhuensis]OVE85438.1 hypothetical protein B2G88_01000 [Natronolimnobius baerhuensis]
MATQQRHATALRTAVQSDPEAIDHEVVESCFDAERASDRTTALQAVSVLATHDLEQALEYTDRVYTRLTDDVLAVQSAAAMAALCLARERPESMVEAIPSLVELLERDPPLLRFRAAGALAPLTESHASAFVPHTDRLLELLVDGPTVDDPQEIANDPALSPAEKTARVSMLTGRGSELSRSRTRSVGTREVIANILVELARMEPAMCADRLPVIVPALSDEEAAVRGGAIEFVRHVAEDEPDTVAPAIDPLLACLEDEVTFVRARAIRALGYAEVTVAIDPLRELADSEESDDVATLATETADWLESELEG